MSFHSVHNLFPWMLLTAQSMALLFTIHPSYHGTEELLQSTGEFCASKLCVCHSRMLLCTHCKCWHSSGDLQLLWRNFSGAADYLVHELLFIPRIHYYFQCGFSCYSGRSSGVIHTFMYFTHIHKSTIGSVHKQDTALVPHPPQTLDNYHSRVWYRA